MTTPEISVIVPVYQVERFLDRCVKSVLAQTFRDFELILIDDGSSDRSGGICDFWHAQDGRIRVFHTSNQGLSAARNYGVSCASGRFVAFVDSDDYVMPEYLETLRHLLELHPDAGYSECGIRIERNGVASDRDASGIRQTFSASEAFASVMYDERLSVAAPGKLFRRGMFDRVRFPEGRRCEDVYAIGELILSAGKVAYEGRSLYGYVLRGDSLTTERAGYGVIRQHYEAALHLTDLAHSYDPGLEKACRRFRAYAAMRLLRHCRSGWDCPAGEMARLRREVLRASPAVLRDLRVRRRDRMGIFLLRLGVGPYLAGWRIYTVLRNIQRRGGKGRGF